MRDEIGDEEEVSVKVVKVRSLDEPVKGFQGSKGLALLDQRNACFSFDNRRLVMGLSLR